MRIIKTHTCELFRSFGFHVALALKRLDFTNWAHELHNTRSIDELIRTDTILGYNPALRLFCRSELTGVPYGIRTRVTAVKGRCPRPLDEGNIDMLSPDTRAVLFIDLNKTICVNIV